MRTRLTPLVVIFVSVGITAAMIAGEFLLLTRLDARSPTFGLPQLSTAAMPDGSVLTLHAVSLGRSHSLAVPVFSQATRWNLQPASMRNISHSTGSDRMVFFISHHDPESGDFRGFDWWSSCEIVDQYGERWRDEHPRRYIYSTSSSRSEGRTRGPFEKIRENNRNFPREGRRIVLGVEFPVLRASADLQLRFLDVDGNLVASLPFVSPVRMPKSEWQPEELPAVREVRGVRYPVSRAVQGSARNLPLETPISLRLNSVGLIERTRSDDSPRPAFSLMVRTEVLENGQPANGWQVRGERVYDILGNESSFGNVGLSVHEPAWRIGFKLTRTEFSRFDASERRTLTGLFLPGPDTATADVAAIQGDGHEFVPVAVFGPGKSSCRISGMNAGNGTRSFGGSVPIRGSDRQPASYRVEWQAEGYRGVARVGITSDVPCLLLRTDALDVDADVLVRTTDDAGNEVTSHVRSFYDFAHLVFFDVDTPVSGLTCELCMQVPVELEFTVKPSDGLDDRPQE